MAASNISNFRLSIPQTQILIDLYRGHEPLWNYANKLYKSRGAKNASYKSMQMAFQAATGMFLPVHIIRTKIKSYRTQFAKEHYLVLQARKNASATDEEYKPKYELYENLKFLSAVVQIRPRPGSENGVNTAPSTPSTEGRSSLLLQDLADQSGALMQDFPVYNSPPSHHEDDDHHHHHHNINNNNLDEHMSCDLSCDSIPDDKHALRSLLEQNGALSPLPSQALERDEDEAGHDDASLSPSHGPRGADEELFLPLFRAQSVNKSRNPQQQRTAAKQHNSGGQRSRKRQRRRRSLTAEEDDAASEDVDTSLPRTREEDGGEGEGGQLVHNLVGCLMERMQRQEERKRERKARKRAAAETEGDRQSGDKLWAKCLVQQLSEIGSQKKRQLLKLKISRMVIDCCMEELDKEG